MYRGIEMGAPKQNKASTGQRKKEINNWLRTYMVSYNSMSSNATAPGKHSRQSKAEQSRLPQNGDKQERQGQPASTTNTNAAAAAASRQLAARSVAAAFTPRNSSDRTGIRSHVVQEG